MKAVRWATALLAAAVLLAGCSRERGVERAEERWKVKGMVKEVNTEAGNAVLAHEDIPGLMPGMTMPFPVASAPVLEGIAVGDAVEFTLERTEQGLVITKMRKLDPSELPDLEASTPQEVSGTGTVVVVNRKAAAVLIRHEGLGAAIPEGELMVEVKPASLLEGIEDGDAVEFTVTREPERLYISKLKKRK